MPETLEGLIKSLKSLGVLRSKKLEEALRKIKREHFVPEKYRGSAYIDYPLPIGHGQTISQPYTVVTMTEMLDVKPGQKILEIGAGSGWQAALLGYLIGPKGKVCTVEINEWLADFARNNISKTGLKNVEVIHGDGSMGLPKEFFRKRFSTNLTEKGFDRIIITAAASKVPEPLKEQLKEGGKLVAPIGNIFNQRMVLFEKKGSKLKEIGEKGYFRFVPLKGEHGIV